MVSSISEICSQTIEDGDWVGKIIHMTGRYMNAVYDVQNTNEGVEISLKVSGYGSFEFRDIRVTPDSLFFVWTPSFDLPCTLARLPDGVYHGVCEDPWGGFGAAIMAPPGSDIDALELHEPTFMSIAGINPDDLEPEIVSLGESYPVGNRVEVNGLTINYVEAGDQQKTVVLIAGIGDNLTSWELLHQRLASQFRVIAYDRPGLGVSQKSDMPRALSQMANQLNRLLHSAGVPPPYILIAHAGASLIARQYTDQYPEEVEGLVFIDPHHEQQAGVWESFDEEAWTSYWTRLKRFQSALSGGSGLEFQMYASLIDQETEASLSDAPSVPTVVLTAGRVNENSSWVGHSKEGRKAWAEFHASWVDRMPNGTHKILDYSSYIHHESPESILEVIQSLFTEK
ncbi:MAG: alpha/beta hydrolase [Bacteroidetes bacterium]|nr:alpha/beta hydrolase [Bacteroidota bacterium]MCY4233446.1 alpha/beta hydrolase [Bacteroidota bacterium]